MNDIDAVKNELDQAKQRIAVLESFVRGLTSSATIPSTVDQAFKDRFFKSTLQVSSVGGTAATQVIVLTGNPQNITVPAQPTGTVAVIINGAIYNLLYA